MSWFRKLKELAWDFLCFLVAYTAVDALFDNEEDDE